MRKIAMYFSWSRPEEISAPLGVLENRFPALFESRRMRWPRYEQFRDAQLFDQGIGGFLDHIQLPNFKDCLEAIRLVTGNPVICSERNNGAAVVALDSEFLAGIDTLIVVSFDSKTTGQRATAAEIQAVRSFLESEDRLVFVCPHHDIGNADDLPQSERMQRQQIEFTHHGDTTIPAQQRFGGFALSLLAGLGLPLENRFGLRPAVLPGGEPAPLKINTAADRFRLLAGVPAFNLHPHLPHFERLGESLRKMEVLAEQAIDLSAPPHPFMQRGRTSFDALLQTTPDTFPGALLVCDTTLWSSTAGGIANLLRFWRNVSLC